VARQSLAGWGGPNRSANRSKGNGSAASVVEKGVKGDKKAGARVTSSWRHVLTRLGCHSPCSLFWFGSFDKPYYEREQF
jgi:hypothetical protein